MHTAEATARTSISTAVQLSAVITILLLGAPWQIQAQAISVISVPQSQTVRPYE